MTQRQGYLTAADIHARVHWPTILEALGIDGALLEIKRGKRGKNAPCPACGGTDRFFFDNRSGCGDFFCSHCGPGDGFKLLERVHRWSFKETRQRVLEAAGLAEDAQTQALARPERPVAAEILAKPSDRVHRLRRGRCAIENCDGAVDYLASRGLWPLPAGCDLKAHASVEYWDQGRRVGHYPALIADVTDIAGELVTCHVTYLQDGKKLTGGEPRKILSPLTGREGCAVRLMPAAAVLGIAEGLETALSAALLDGLPVWGALNTSLLSRFDPPPEVSTLRIYADRDEAGLIAAARLMERLQGRVRCELCVPRTPYKDFNDHLTARAGEPHV